MEDIEKLIRKNTPAANKDTKFEIEEVTSEAPFAISGTRYFFSSYQFNIDPVPWDFWILIDGKLKKGHDFINIIKKKIYPKAKEEALKIAKLIIFVLNHASEDKTTRSEVIESNGIFLVNISKQINDRFCPYVSKYVIKLGKNICEVSREDIPKEK